MGFSATAGRSLTDLISGETWVPWFPPDDTGGRAAAGDPTWDQLMIEICYLLRSEKEDSGWLTNLWCAVQGYRWGSANILFRFYGVAIPDLDRRASPHGSTSSSFSSAKSEKTNLALAELLH